MGLIQPTTFKLLNTDQLANIEGMADRILCEIGIDLKEDPLSLEVMQSIGAEVEGERVRIDGQVLRDIIAKNAPGTFIWRGITDDTSVVLGGDSPVFAPMFGAPNVRRWDNSTRLGTYEDYVELIKLCDRSDMISTTGYLLCIVHDKPEQTRHLDMAKAHLEKSKKPMMGTVLSEQALREVAAEVGATMAKSGECQLLHMINTTPPMTCQSNPLKCLRAASELGQGCLVSSYMMMGATSPVTILASLAQGLAEIMIGIALTQIYRPGVPVAGGIFATPFSMRSMLPTFGTPESQLAQIAGLQLVKRLGVPSRGDGFLTSSKLNDAQAGYEGSRAMLASLSGGADLILHSAGWLENGRCVDFNKFKQDAQLLSSPQFAHPN